ncbi:hypothetical protein [Abyssicoccus albus]|uniref:hypothetical protein n=1 Tax=Abyssicoccus albus TaxID=1817405 RepID=UPI00097E2A08|nr:hypothetical protein [Abyssicoccus albus]AQL55829.1 hypothetical protein BVH56_02170 [Abyssicoccus albus]
MDTIKKHYNLLLQMFKRSFLSFKTNFQLHLMFNVISLTLFILLTIFLKLKGSDEIFWHTSVFRLIGFILWFWVTLLLIQLYRTNANKNSLWKLSSTPLYYQLFSRLIPHFYSLYIHLLIIYIFLRLLSIDFNLSIVSIIFFTLMFTLLMMPLILIYFIILQLISIEKIFIVMCSLIMLLTTPIFWLPNSLGRFILLMNINPLYYTVNGLQSSYVLGYDQLFNTVIHVLFISIIIMLSIWSAYSYLGLKKLSQDE